jgi:hypothetical protein
MKINKIGQEEMVGFGMIIIIVSVVLLIVLGFALRQNSSSDNLQNYEVESFIQSFLHYTTDCENSIEALSIDKLIFTCYTKEQCIDGRDSCQVLNETMSGIIKESWAVGDKSPYKGYELNITVEGKPLINMDSGNKTANSKGSRQFLSKDYGDAEVIFKVYS